MVAPGLLVAQLLTSCGSDEEGGTACEANVLRACPGPEGCAGEQVCAADGSGYGACTCDGVASSNGGAGGSGAGGSANAAAAGSTGIGAGGSGDAPAAPLFAAELRAVGAPCASDAECPVGPGGEAPLTCITQTNATAFGAGGPQGGYCTMPCRENEQCGAVDALSVCTLRDEAGDGYCISLCQAGANAVKCQLDDVRAQACLPPPAGSANNIGVCVPVCTSDESCGEGQFCSLDPTGAALCTTTEPTGGDVGAPCTVETAEADCKSDLCVALQSADGGTVSFCSSVCTFGNFDEGCGFSPASGAAREAYCAEPTEQTGDFGDLGFCVELCDTAEDCGQPDWECLDLTETGQSLLGRTGECVPPGTGAAIGDVGDAGAP